MTAASALSQSASSQAEPCQSEPLPSSARSSANKLESAVWDALDGVFDPEYPDISIVDLGLVETVTNDSTENVSVGLIPTFSGCPALAMIAQDVEAAVSAVPGVSSMTSTWLTSPIWTTQRTSASAQQRLSGEYTVILRRKDGTLRCPICGSDAVADQSMAGPTRCRSIAWCSSCRNPVEVMR